MGKYGYISAHFRPQIIKFAIFSYSSPTQNRWVNVGIFQRDLIARSLLSALLSNIQKIIENDKKTMKIRAGTPFLRSSDPFISVFCFFFLLLLFQSFKVTAEQKIMLQ